MLKKGTCSRNNCPFLPCSGADASAGAAENQQQPPARPTADPLCYPVGHPIRVAAEAAARTAARGRTHFLVLHADKAERTRKMREHSVSSEDFFAPGTRTAASDLKPRWFKDIPEDDSDCQDY